MRLFEKGNFTDPARGDQKDWRTFAAKGLLGLTNDALARLENETSDEARFYLAATYWIAGEEEQARAVLKDLKSEEAGKFAALISKPKIKVLSQWFSTGRPPHLLHTGIAADPKFQITNLGFNDGDRPYDHDCPVEDLIDTNDPPDFFISVMAEWHVMPPGLFDLPCPIFAHTGDFDLHAQAVLPQLRGFDEVIVTEGSEWRDCAAVLPGPVSTFPKMFGLAGRDLPPIPEANTERDIDLFMSGTVLHPYHPDKAKLFHQVLQSRAEPLFVNGFLPGNRYMEILGRAKLVLSHVRHSGAIPTRALEALAMGCPVLVPGDSVLWLYLDEEDGLIPYDLEEGPAPAIDRVLADWKCFGERAHRGAAKVRALFDETVVAPQYLRYLTFRAALAQPNPHRREAAEAWQKRPIVSKGRLSISPAEAANVGMVRSNTWRHEVALRPDVVRLNDLGRELALIQAAAAQGLGSEIDVSRFPEDAMDLFEEAADLDETALVPRLNAIRVGLHFGDHPQMIRARALMEQVVSTPEDQWRARPDEDVLSYDFFPEFLDYRSYTDQLVKVLAGEAEDRTLVPPLLASVHYYRGRLGGGARSYGEAVRLAPDFPAHRLGLAKALLREKGDMGKVFALLEDLAANSILALEALDLLIKLAAAMGQPTEGAQRLIARLQGAFIQLEDHQLRFTTPHHAARILERWGGGGPQIQEGGRKCEAPRLSFLILRTPGDPGLPTLQALAADPALVSCEVLWVEPFDLPTPGARAFCDKIIVANQQDLCAHSGHMANLALSQARGDWVALLEGKGAPPPLGPLLEELATTTQPLILHGKGNPKSGTRAFVDALFDHSQAHVLALPRQGLAEGKGFNQHGILNGALGGGWEVARRQTGGKWVPPLHRLANRKAGPGWAEIEEMWTAILDK